MTRSTFIFIFCLAGATDARADLDCFDFTAGVKIGVASDQPAEASEFLLVEYQCNNLSVKSHLEFGTIDTEFEVQEAFYDVELSSTYNLTLGKKIFSFDKSQFFKPLDFFQSTKLAFDFRDLSGDLAGLPVVGLQRFGENGTVTALASRDSESQEDGVNKGLDQIVLAYAFVQDNADVVIVYRFADGDQETHSIGVSANYPLSDYVVLSGTLNIQRNLRRQDKLLALSLLGNSGSASSSWHPQIALGLQISVPTLPDYLLLVEGFHNDAGLDDQEWNVLGRGFSPEPFLRQDYINVAFQHSKGAFSNRLSLIHSVDDGSTDVGLGVQYSQGPVSWDAGINRGFGSSTSEFGTGTTRGFFQMRYAF